MIIPDELTNVNTELTPVSGNFPEKPANKLNVPIFSRVLPGLSTNTPGTVIDSSTSTAVNDTVAYRTLPTFFPSSYATVAPSRKEGVQ
jgi:hypothetical protein